MPRINAVPFYENRTLEGICRTIVDAGFDSLELCRPHFIERLVTPELRKTFSDWASGLSLSFLGVDVWVDVQPYEAPERTLDDFRAVVDFAADLDLGHIITTEGQIDVVGGRTKSECLTVLVPLFQQVADVAASREITVLIEPHPDTLSIDNAFTIELIDGVDRANIGLVYDCAHYAVGQPETYVASIEQLGERIRHLHFSDGDARTYSLHLPLGEGTLDLDGMIAALKDVGFNGTLTNDIWGYPMLEDGARRNAARITALEQILGLAQP
jgi:sugar phosphate isomerase/epimerase